MNVVCAKDGKPYFVDSEGEYWRVYRFIEGATCYEQVAGDEDFYQSGYAFGNFQCLLSDYPAETLHEQSHSSMIRQNVFGISKMLEKDVMGREFVQREI